MHEHWSFYCDVCRSGRFSEDVEGGWFSKRLVSMTCRNCGAHYVNVNPRRGYPHLRRRR
jgi:hypothetical protein